MCINRRALARAHQNYIDQKECVCAKRDEREKNYLIKRVEKIKTPCSKCRCLSLCVRALLKWLKIYLRIKWFRKIIGRKCIVQLTHSDEMVAHSLHSAMNLNALFFSQLNSYWKKNSSQQLTNQAANRPTSKTSNETCANKHIYYVHKA